MNLNWGSQKVVTILILLLLVMSAISTTGCFWNDEKENDQNGTNNNIVPNGKTNNETEFEKRINQINQKAVIWLGTLNIDPIKLRSEMGIKGKKKFVELLDSYLILYQTASTEENKSKYKNIVTDLVQVTDDPDYHDMNEINDTQFREDSTSYLRAWYIMMKFGLDTSYYESEIEQVMPRMDAHLPNRGINQKMVFVFYYNRLGYHTDYTLEELFEYSVIRSRKNITQLDNIDVYFVTHEVFALYDDEKISYLTDDDITYLKEIINYQINKTISENNVDLLAELIMIMTYLNLSGLNDYKVALDFLLISQNDDGSFGDYEYAREYYEKKGIDIEIQLYLHTTEVSLRALNEAVDVFNEVD